MQQEQLLLNLTNEESERDQRWAEDTIRLLMQNSFPVISKTDYDKGWNILFGIFPELERNKLFQGKIMSAMKDKLSGSTVYFFEKIRNAIIDERTSSDLSVTLNSLDPEKEVKKKSDRELLVNRKGIEALLNQITGNNGMPPQSFKPDDFHGNIEDFDSAGMDELDTDNVVDFFDSKWGLKSEMLLQNVVNAVVKLNQIPRKYDKYINDILIAQVVCSQIFVDEVEGKIKVERLHPGEIEVLSATGENDEKNAQGFRIRKRTNIRGLIRKFGNAFSFEDNWKDLLATVNLGRPSPYTGIYENNLIVYGEGKLDSCISMSNFLNEQINYSYCEFRTINQNTRYKGVDKNGNIVNMPYNQVSTRDDKYQKESKQKEDTYRAYFLEFGALSPKIIKWGKLFMMPTEGVYDEYSGFSILVNRRIGVPMVTILKPFYQIMQVAFTMFEILVNDVKPDGWDYNYNSLVKIAEHLYAAKDTPTDVRKSIDDVLQMFQGSPNRISVNNTDEEDNITGGDGSSMKRIENGLNKAAGDLMKIMDWCEQKATDYLGTQGIEFAEPKDGYKLSIENRKRSRAATQFIDFILLNHIEDQAIMILNYAQDISKFKNTAPYNYLETLVGTNVIEFLASMKKSPHRYGVFLDTFNNDIQLLELRQMAKEDVTNQRLSLEQYAFICSFENVKQAVFYLAQERKKADKKKAKDQQTIFQQQEAAAQAAFERTVQLENIKGRWRNQAEDKRSAGFVQASQINAQAQITAKQLQEQGQNERLATTANNDIAKIAEHAEAVAQKSVPVPT